MSKETKNAKFSIWREVVLLIMPILLCIVLDYGFCDLSLMMISAKTILLSTIIMGCLLMLLTACCKKMNRATYILSGFILLLIIINSVKYAYTNMPILLTDIGYLKNIFGITSLVKDDIISNINFSSIIICTIFLTILCFITKKMDFEIKTKKQG